MGFKQFSYEDLVINVQKDEVYYLLAVVFTELYCFVYNVKDSLDASRIFRIADQQVHEDFISFVVEYVITEEFVTLNCY